MTRIFSDMVVEPIDRILYDPTLLWTIVGVVAAAVAVTVVLVVVLVKRKNKKKNQ